MLVAGSECVFCSRCHRTPSNPRLSIKLLYVYWTVAKEIARLSALGLMPAPAARSRNHFARISTGTTDLSSIFVPSCCLIISSLGKTSRPQRASCCYIESSPRDPGAGHSWGFASSGLCFASFRTDAFSRLGNAQTPSP